MKNERKIRWVKLTRKCSGIQSIRINKNVDSTIANVDVSMYPINMVSQWDWWGYECRCKWDITEITNHMICGFNWKRTIRPRNVIMINHLFCWYPFVFEQTHIIIYRDSQTCGIRLECSRLTVYQTDFGYNCWILLVGSGGYFVVRPCKVRTTSSP